MGEMRRRGATSKCPACGWGHDENAYRCPNCRIYFCYRCRARVPRQEKQYQCADQSRSCYGKLLCSACTTMVPQMGPVTRPTFNIAPEVFVWVAAIVGVVVGIWSGSFWIGAGGAVVILIVGVILSTLKTTTMETLAVHRCCIQCRHPVKNL
ncbi:MAG: hypothetical protein RMJ52_08250 [Gemmataceae bacterium]|nr:hypothetical protein [Gemmataceae bacterium]